ILCRAHGNADRGRYAMQKFGAGAIATPRHTELDYRIYIAIDDRGRNEQVLGLCAPKARTEIEIALRNLGNLEAALIAYGAPQKAVARLDPLGNGRPRGNAIRAPAHIILAILDEEHPSLGAYVAGKVTQDALPEFIDALLAAHTLREPDLPPLQPLVPLDVQSCMNEEIARDPDNPAGEDAQAPIDRCDRWVNARWAEYKVDHDEYSRDERERYRQQRATGQQRQGYRKKIDNPNSRTKICNKVSYEYQAHKSRERDKQQSFVYALNGRHCQPS